jgi:hypothetical protein
MKIFKGLKNKIIMKNPKQVKKINISEKQCPHCTNRGMFVFSSNFKENYEIEKKEK